LERDESEETVAHYTMGSGLEAMRRETSSFYHYNHLGTALALTGADEAVTDTYRHDAWGVLLASTGSTVNPHTYVGRERYYRMPNAAMYHLGFRDYAQGLGRFTTVDPLVRMPRHGRPRTAWLVSRVGAQRRSLSPSWLPENVLAKYGYAINQPVSFIDPSGAIPPFIIGICVIGVVLISGCGGPGDETDERPPTYPKSPLTEHCLNVAPEEITDPCNPFGCDDCCSTLAYDFLGPVLIAADLVMGKDDVIPTPMGDKNMVCEDACLKACSDNKSGKAGIEGCLTELGKDVAVDAVLETLFEDLVDMLPDVRTR
jgi:hypothetical protein